MKIFLILLLLNASFAWAQPVAPEKVEPLPKEVTAETIKKFAPQLEPAKVSELLQKQKEMNAQQKDNVISPQLKEIQERNLQEIAPKNEGFVNFFKSSYLNIRKNISESQQRFQESRQRAKENMERMKQLNDNAKEAQQRANEQLRRQMEEQKRMLDMQKSIKK